MLVQQVYRPQNSMQLMKTLDLVDTMAESVKLYKLVCNMEIEAAKIAFEGMQ